MVYEIKDGRGGVSYTSDPAEAFYDLMDGDTSYLYRSPLENFLIDLSRSAIDAVTCRRQINACQEEGRSQAYNAAHTAFFATVDLISAEDGESLRQYIEAADATDSFLKLSGALSHGIVRGVILDNEHTKKLINTLNDAAGNILGIPNGSNIEDAKFEASTALAHCSYATVQQECARVLADCIAWSGSDSMVQSLRLTVP